MASTSGSTDEAVLRGLSSLLRGHVDPTSGTDNPRCVRVRQAPQRGLKTLEGSSTEGVMGS